MPLGKLFAITKDSSDYNEGTRRGVFYAQSWALMHYWLFGTDGRTRERMMAFVKALGQPKADPERCFREAFGMSFDAMEAALRDHLKTGRYYVKRARLALGDFAAQVELRPATDFEREFGLANLRWHTQRTGDHAYQLQRFADRDPKSPRPHEVLATVAMRDGLVPGAVEHWKRAVARGSQDPFVFLQLVKAQFGPIIATFTLDERLSADTAATLRGWIGRALELSPDYTECYELLAMVEAMAEQPRMAVIARVQQAEPGMRDPFFPSLGLAIVGWRTNQLIASRDRCERLLARPDTPPQVRAIAGELLRRIARGK